jgi:CheY-like chemotaxis protein
MSTNVLNILLADDDVDDCIFFKKALETEQSPAHLTTVPDGEHLMRILTNSSATLPDILFLDLNMPRKNGFECLTEIKQTERLKDLPVVVFSTSFEQEVVNRLYSNGARYFIRKPADFLQFRKIILHALLLISNEGNSYPTRENFVITS